MPTTSNSRPRILTVPPTSAPSCDTRSAPTVTFPRSSAVSSRPSASVSSNDSTPTSRKSVASTIGGVPMLIVCTSSSSRKFSVTEPRLTPFAASASSSTSEEIGDMPKPAKVEPSVTMTLSE